MGRAQARSGHGPGSQKELEAQNRAIYLLNLWQSRSVLRSGFDLLKQSGPIRSARRSTDLRVKEQELQERTRNVNYAIAVAEIEKHDRIQSMIFDTLDFRITFTRPSKHLGLDFQPNEVSQH